MRKPAVIGADTTAAGGVGRGSSGTSSTAAPPRRMEFAPAAAQATAPAPAPSPAPSPPPPPPPVVEAVDLNKLAGKMLRAKLMGKMDLHAQLAAQLEAAKAAQAGGGGGSGAPRSGAARPAPTASRGGGRGGDGDSDGDGAAAGPKEEVVTISGLDEYGRPIRSLARDYKLGM